MPDAPTPDLARRLYLLLETVHVAVYVLPEPRQAFAALGVTTGYGELVGYSGYVGSRAAPLGRVTAATVEATFGVFSRRLVAACVPSVWEVASPAALTEARYAGVQAGLHRVVLRDGSEEDAGRVAVSDADLRAAGGLLEEAVAGLSPAARPLFAAQAALPEPEDALTAVWHWCTALREHRGDAHLAALADAGLSGLEAIVLHAAVGGPREFLLRHRGWTPQEWAEGEERLRAAGLVDADGVATEAGLEGRRRVEERTEVSAARAWTALGEGDAGRLAGLLEPVAQAVRAADVPGGTAHRVGH